MNPDSKRKEILKRLLILVPIAIGVALVFMLMRNQKEPEKKITADVSRQVRTIRVQPMDLVPRAIGYGYVEPGQVWQVVPEVSGRIIQVSPAFKKGNFVRKGEVLVTIDPTDYQLTVRQMSASIESIRAQLAELTRQEKNYASSLTIQKTLLGLKQKELARNQQAMQTHSISSSALDQSLMNYQSQLAQVQDIENALNLIPTSRQTLDAELKSSQAQLEAAQVDLKRTEIVVPFNCRITETSAEAGQYVQQGTAIARADGTGRAEITAQLPMEKMLKLIAGAGGQLPTASAETMDRIKMDAIKDRFGLNVRVHLVNAGDEAMWDADFTRTDATIDAQTRTVGIIVAVDNPYGSIIFGKRPPLVRNMFCEVEFSGRPLSEKIVIPRSALHDGQVYLVDNENRLRRRAVTVDFTQSDFGVIRQGLSAGEQVVVSDVMPAIDGMLLSTTEDEALYNRLVAQAGGLTDIR